MRLSVLDLVPVRTDQTTADALAATVRLGQTADRLGLTPYWVAENHNMPAVGAPSPPVLIAYLAAQTAQLRLGSGGVMLPNHAPLAVAEQFALLEAAAPGRIDLGIGRAPGSDAVSSVARPRRARRPRHRPVSAVPRPRAGDDERARRAGATARRRRLHPQGHSRGGQRAPAVAARVRGV